MRLCVVGGGPLVAGRLTLAQCGIGANSSLQLLGRLAGGGGELVLRGKTYAPGEAGRLDLAGQGLGPGEVARLASWLATDAGAAVASLKMAGANFGPIYTACDALLFQVESSDRGVAFRNSPNMDDRCEDGAGPDALEYVYAIHDIDEWLQVSEKKWLPKKFFIQVDTSSPCTFRVFCDALRPSPVTEVDFSSCGLGPAAMPILSDYVRDATAAVNSVTVDGNLIGCPSSATLKPGAVTGIEVKKGVFAAVDGRFGE
eukprot:COSAG02_NODE_12023_length_1611_cov_1.497354_1_plen_256_part_10